MEISKKKKYFFWGGGGGGGLEDFVDIFGVIVPKPHVLAQMPVLYYLYEHRRKDVASPHICFVLSGPSSQMAIECHFVRAAKALASLHICTGLH